MNMEQAERFNEILVKAMKAVSELGNYAVSQDMDHEKIKEVSTLLMEIQVPMMWAEREFTRLNFNKPCDCVAPIIETGINSDAQVNHLVVYARWSALALRAINGLDHKKSYIYKAICSRCGAKAHLD